MMIKKGLRGLFIINGYLKNQKFMEIYDMLNKAAIDYNISLVLFSNDEILSIIDNSDDSKKFSQYDFSLFWDKDIILARYIEKMGIRVINSSYGIEICDDKAKTHIELMRNDILMPKTIVAPMTYNNIGYTNYNFLDKIEHVLSYPIVVKERSGSFGMQVYKADTYDEMLELTKLYGHNNLIYQEFIETNQCSDIRVNMIGQKCVASMKRIALEGDFRSNITNGGSMHKYEPNDNEISICQKVMRALNLDYAGIDLLVSKDKKVYVCEVNSNAHFKNIYDCTGINCASELMKYIRELFSYRNEQRNI